MPVLPSWCRWRLEGRIVFVNNTMLDVNAMKFFSRPEGEGMPHAPCNSWPLSLEPAPALQAQKPRAGVGLKIFRPCERHTRRENDTTQPPNRLVSNQHLTPNKAA